MHSKRRKIICLPCVHYTTQGSPVHTKFTCNRLDNGPRPNDSFMPDVPSVVFKRSGIPGRTPGAARIEVDPPRVSIPPQGETTLIMEDADLPTS